MNWMGPYAFIQIDGGKFVVHMPNRRKSFLSHIVKSFLGSKLHLTCGDCNKATANE